MRDEALALAAVAVTVLAVSRRARRAVWAALCGAAGSLLSLAALMVERRRHLERPARPPAVRRWRVRLSVIVDGRQVVIADGDVTGPWLSAAEVREGALRRLAEVGDWPAGAQRVYAEAWPLASAAQPTI